MNFLLKINDAITKVHDKISHAEKNRYQVAEDICVWYNKGTIEFIFMDGHCYSVLENKMVDKSLGNKGFIVDIAEKFEAEYRKILIAQPLDFSVYLRSIINAIFYPPH